MKKLWGTMFLLLSADAFAFTGISIDAAGTKSHVKSKPLAECTDFSGVWQGTCQKDLPTNNWQETIAIEQPNCSLLRFGRVWLSVGQVTSANAVLNTGGLNAFDETIYTDWNNEKSKMIMSISGGSRALDGKSERYNGRGFLTLDDDRLTFSVDATDAVSGQKNTMTCTYTKI